MRPRPQSRCRVWGPPGSQAGKPPVGAYCYTRARDIDSQWTGDMGALPRFFPLPLSCFFDVFVREASGPPCNTLLYLGISCLHLVQIQPDPFQCLLVVHL